MVELLRSSPLQRLCLVGPSTGWARRTAVAFSVYHAVKLAHRDVVDRAVQTNDFESVHTLLMSLSTVFGKELCAN